MAPGAPPLLPPRPSLASLRVTLTARDALAAAVALALLALAVRRRPASAYAAQAGVVLALYAAWQLGQSYLVTRTAGAADRGLRIWDLERALHLPSEAAVQRAVLAHPAVASTAEHYYALVHFPAMSAFLLWAFVRHRDAFPRIRSALMLATGVSMLLQAVPVAPPRLVPALGVVDSAALAGRAVYSPGGITIPDQLTAMPSVHVLWSLLIACSALRWGRGRGRWLLLTHPAVTVWVVVATGNHYWLDGAVSAGLLALALTARPALRTLLRRTVPRWISTPPAASCAPPTAPSSSPAAPTGACRPHRWRRPSMTPAVSSSAPAPTAPRPATSGATPARRSAV